MNGRNRRLLVITVSSCRVLVYEHAQSQAREVGRGSGRSGPVILGPDRILADSLTAEGLSSPIICPERATRRPDSGFPQPMCHTPRNPIPTGLAVMLCTTPSSGDPPVELRQKRTGYQAPVPPCGRIGAADQTYRTVALERKKARHASSRRQEARSDPRESAGEPWERLRGLRTGGVRVHLRGGGSGHPDGVKSCVHSTLHVWGTWT